MPVATTIFHALTCEDFENGARLLRADYSIDCASPKHTFFEIFAAMSVIFIVIGQPVVLLCTVVFGKRAIDRGETEGVLVVIFHVLSEASSRAVFRAPQPI